MPETRSAGDQLVADQLTKLTELVTTTNTSLAKLETNLTATNTSLAKLETNVTDLATKHEEMKTKMSKLESDLGALTAVSAGAGDRNKRSPADQL